MLIHDTSHCFDVFMWTSFFFPFTELISQSSGIENAECGLSQGATGDYLPPFQWSELSTNLDFIIGKISYWKYPVLLNG